MDRNRPEPAGDPLAGVIRGRNSGSGLLWLANQGQTGALKTFLQTYALSHPEIEAILNGAAFGNPATDNRTPDLVVQLNPGFNYVGNTASTVKRAEHGGVFNTDDTAVPLIVSEGGLQAWQHGLSIADLTDTTSVAPTILADLGLPFSGLNGVQLEGTQPLTSALAPEPASMAVLLSAFADLGFARRRRG